jgi:hypothetical protein
MQRVILVTTDETLKPASTWSQQPHGIDNSGSVSRTHTLVNPGKSTNVKSKTLGLYIRRLIGSLLIPLFWPATLNVSRSISFRISLKSVNRLSTWRNCPHSVYVGVEGVSEDEGSEEEGAGVWMSWRTSGRRVTMP